MPELPEVETTLRGISPVITGQKITRVIVRDRRLRWPIPARIEKSLTGETIIGTKRRAKYLLLQTNSGTLIIHLGMSGNLRVLPLTVPAIKHDHFEIVFKNNHCLRFHDPRRFGCILWTKADPMQHKLLNTLGIEPLGSELTGEFLFANSRKRKVAIKQLLMNSKILVGVGNIYASEVLFLAGINPVKAANKISLKKYSLLADKIKIVLKSAIEQGGTTLRDFVSSDGKPGYFQQKLNVYGREGQNCTVCKKPIKQIRQGQRSTYYCSTCQK